MNRPSKAILVSALMTLAVGHAQAVGRAAVVDEADLGTRWTPAPGVVQVIPGLPAGVARNKDVCVAIGYSISTEGGTSSFTQLQAWSSDPADAAREDALQSYVQTSAAAVSMWKFVPKGRARAVFTVATFGFPGSSGSDQASVRSHCEIKDLEDFIAKLQNQEQDRSSLLKSRMEQYRREHRTDDLRTLFPP